MADFDRIRELFLSARALAPDERSEFVANRAEGDASLAAEVLRLLDADQQPAGLLSKSAETLASGLRPKGIAHPQHIGPFRILGVLGRGGMSVVYRGQQETPRREVAVKVLQAGLSNPEMLRRFELESQILGHLNHPTIAQIFEAGSFDFYGEVTPYFAMELVDGLPLTVYAREHKLDTRGRLELLATIARAVQHAHDRGVIHRDLKPSNVLVTEASPGQALPKVLDFGIARSLDSTGELTALHTSTGQLMGTLPYMSPEQISGRSNGVGARSDLYALGVLLYELLTGNLPHDLSGLPLTEVVRIVTQESPTRLGHERTELRGDLETIAATALAKDPRARYPSADSFADDLERYLNHEPIRARPPTRWYRIRKFVRRHRLLVSSTVALVAAMTIALVVVGGLAQENAELATREQRTNAELRQRLYESQMIAAGRTLGTTGGPSRVREILEDWLPKPGAPDLRGWEWRYLHTASHRGMRAVALETPIQRLMPSPRADELLALRAGRVARLAKEDARERGVLMRTENGFPYASIASELRFVALRFREQGVRVVDVTNGQRVGDFDVGHETRQPSLSASRRALCCSIGSGKEQGKYRIFDLGESDEALTLTPSRRNRSFLSAFSPDGSVLATTVTPGVELWNTATWTRTKTIDEYPEWPSCLAWSKDGKRLAVGDRTGEVFVFDRAGQLVYRDRPHDDWVLTLAWNPDAQRLASAGRDQVVRVLDLRKRQRRDLAGHSDVINSLVWSKDGKKLYSCGEDRTLREWDLTVPPARRLLGRFGHIGYRGLGWSHDGRAVWPLKLVEDNLYKRLRNPAVVSKAIEHEKLAQRGPQQHEHKELHWRVILDAAGKSRLWDVALDPAQRHIAFAEASRFSVRRIEDRKIIATIDPLDGQPTSVDWLADGRTVVISDRSNTVRLWRPFSDSVALELRGHSASVWTAESNPSGTRIASGSKDGTICIWNITTGRQTLVLHIGKQVRHVAWSPDGHRLAAYDHECFVHVFDARQGDATAPRAGKTKR